MKGTRRLVLLALMTSLALVLSIIESWIQIPVPVYGVKLGLANIVTLAVLIFFGPGEAVLVVIARVALSSIFGGGFVIFLFSISGGLLSTVVMAFLQKRGSAWFSILGVSIAGSIMHNIGQLLVASMIMKEIAVMTYLPVLLISGVVMGCFTGLCTRFMVKAMERSKIGL